MKFPYELSKDRQSLLSKEDRELYEYEHSPFFSYQDKVRSIRLYQLAKQNRQRYYERTINEDEEFRDLEPAEKSYMARKLTEVEALEIMDQVMDIIDPNITRFVDKEDLDAVKKNTVKMLMADPERPAEQVLDDSAEVLTESGGAPGHDMTYWIPELKWLFDLGAGILSAGAVGIAGLVMAGYDKIAAKQLEKYMNKLVELTDTGVHKKKSFFSFFGLGKNKGDQSQACFRSIQEFVERDQAKNVLIAGKACGLLTGNGLNDAMSNTYENGGLLGSVPRSFKTNVMDKIDTLVKKA